MIKVAGYILIIWTILATAIAITTYGATTRVAQLESTVEKYEELGRLYEKANATDERLHAAYQKVIDELKRDAGLLEAANKKVVVAYDKVIADLQQQIKTLKEKEQ